MLTIHHKIRTGLTLLLSGALLITSCNKDPEDFPVPEFPEPTGDMLGTVLANSADDSLYNRLVIRAGMANALNSTDNYYTMFVPGNNAMKQFISAASGGLVPIGAPDAVFSGFIQTQISPENAYSIVNYNIVPQSVNFAEFGTSFPNFQYPSLLNPAPSISALLRLTTFPSARNGNWVNNVPITVPDREAGNGRIHSTAALVLPPSRYLWDRISTDTDFEFFKAAIIRADSATNNGGSGVGTLQGYLMNIGANFTVFAPTDDAFQGTLIMAITQVLVSQGVPLAVAQAQAAALAATPDIFQNPALYPYITAQLVQGIVVYHIAMGRAFTNNFPTTQTNIPTLLNSAIPTHGGVGIQVTMGAPFATAATVKGAENPTPANILINASPLTPDPSGTSDQHFLNGVLHKIDQLLLPLPL
jgi:uncharacterized surface protein with fasciclin (FAS1) repeats